MPGSRRTPEHSPTRCSCRRASGTLQTEMLAAARRYGALAVPLQPQLDALLRRSRAGHPVVVLQNLGLELVGPRWHYAVLVGYDVAERGGAAAQRHHRARGDGLRAVRAHLGARPHAGPSSRWRRAACRRRRSESDSVQAAIAFERVAPPQQALRAYDSLVERWPRQRAGRAGPGQCPFGGRRCCGRRACFRARGGVARQCGRLAQPGRRASAPGPARRRAGRCRARAGAGPGCRAAVGASGRRAAGADAATMTASRIPPRDQNDSSSRR